MDNQCASAPVTLTVLAEPCFARLVRMTAANVAMLSNMSVEKIEDVRMAAEEAFVYACATEPEELIDIVFTVDDQHLAMSFDLGDIPFEKGSADDPTAVYTDLILASVCDTYEKREHPAALLLDLRADV